MFELFFIALLYILLSVNAEDFKYNKELEDGLESYLTHIERVKTMFYPKDHINNDHENAMKNHRRSIIMDSNNWGLEEYEPTVLHPFQTSDQIRKVAQNDPLFQFGTGHLQSESEVLGSDKEKLKSISTKKVKFSMENLEPYTGARSKIKYSSRMHKGSINFDVFDEIEITDCQSSQKTRRDVVLKIEKKEKEVFDTLKKKWIPGTRFVTTNCPDIKILYGLVMQRRTEYEDEEVIIVRFESVEIPFSKFFFNTKVEAMTFPGNETKVNELLEYFQVKSGRRYELDKSVSLQAFNWNYDNVEGMRKEEKKLWEYNGAEGEIVVKCTDCWAYLNADFWIKLETSWGSLVHFEVGMSGNFKSQVELFAEGTYEKLYQMHKNLLDLHVCSVKFFIACFPMMVDFDFTIDLYVNIRIYGHFIATESVELSADASLKYVFDEEDGENDFYSSFSNSVDYTKPTLEADGTFFAKAWLDSGLHVKPYSLFDIIFIPEGWVQFDLEANLQQNLVTMELSRGINILAEVPPIEVLGMEFTLDDTLPMKWEYEYQAKTVMPCTFSSCTSPSTMLMKESDHVDPSNVNDNFDNIDSSASAEQGSDNGLDSGSMTGFLGEGDAVTPPTKDLPKKDGLEPNEKEWLFYNNDEAGKSQAMCNCHGDSNCYVKIGYYNMTSGNYTWYNDDDNRYDVLWEDEWSLTLTDNDLHAAMSVVVKDNGMFAVAFLPRVDVEFDEITGVQTINKGRALVLDTSFQKVDFSDNIILSVIHEGNPDEFAAFLVRVRIFDSNEVQVCQTNGYQPIVVKQKENEFRIWSTAGEDFPCPEDVNTYDYSMDITLRAFAGNKPDSVQFKIALDRVNVIGRRYTVPKDQLFLDYGYLFKNFKNADEYIVEFEDATASNNLNFSIVSGGYGVHVDNNYFLRTGVDSSVRQFFKKSDFGFSPSVGNKNFVVTLENNEGLTNLTGITALSVIPIENIKSGVRKYSTIGTDQNQCFRNPTNVNKEGTYSVDYTDYTVIIRRNEDAMCGLWVNVFTLTEANGWQTLFESTIEDKETWIKHIELTHGDVQDLYVYVEHVSGVDKCEFDVQVFQEIHIFDKEVWKNVRVGPSEWLFVLSTDPALQNIKFEFQDWEDHYRMGSYVHHTKELVDVDPIYVQDISFSDLLMILDSRPFYQDIGHTSGEEFLGLYNPGSEELLLQIQLNDLPVCELELVFEGTDVEDVQVDIVKSKYEGLPFSFDITKCDNAHFFNKDVVSNEILDSTLASLVLHNVTGTWIEYEWWNNFVQCFRDIVNPKIAVGDYASIYEYINIADNPNILRLKVPPCDLITISEPGETVDVILDHKYALGDHVSGGGNTYKILAAEDFRTKITGQKKITFFAPECDQNIWDIECRIPKCHGSVDGCGDNGNCTIENEKPKCVCMEGYTGSKCTSSGTTNIGAILGIVFGTIGGIIVICLLVVVVAVVITVIIFFLLRTKTIKNPSAMEEEMGETENEKPQQEVGGDEKEIAQI